MFLTWSALVNLPEVECNPTLHTTNKTVVINGTSTVILVADLRFTWMTAVSILILLISVVYASIRTSSHSSVGRLTMSVSGLQSWPSRIFESFLVLNTDTSLVHQTE